MSGSDIESNHSFDHIYKKNLDTLNNECIRSYL